MNDTITITDIYSYPMSQELYDAFKVENLLAAVNRAQNIAGSEATNKQVRDCLATVLQTIDFGPVTHLKHDWLNGQPEPAAAYPTATTTTPLLGYRIGLGTTPGALPRAVLTAGMHAQEVAPSLALVRYFRQLLVNYARGKVFPDKAFPDKSIVAIDHPGFNYQSGDYLLYDAAENVVELTTEAEKKIYRDDVSLSPDKDTYIKIDACTITDGAQIREILEKLEIILLPVINPAGRDFVLTKGVDEGPQSKEARQKWRKNRAPLQAVASPNNKFGTGAVDDTPNSFSKGLKMRPIGVDINRNADIAWDPDTYYKKASGQSDTNTHNAYNFINYAGGRVNSERETCAVVTALTSLTPAQMVIRTAAAQPVGAAPPLVQLTTPPPAAEAYLGPLFYLDIHAHFGDICLPWGIECNGNVREQNFLNKDYNGLRDGVDDQVEDNLKNIILSSTTKDTYYEYFPQVVKYGPKGVECKLFQVHLETFSHTMQTYIQDRVAGKSSLVVPPGTPAPKKPLESPLSRMNVRSNYRPVPAASLYVATGVLNDYAFSLNIRDIENLPLAGTNTFTPGKVEKNLVRTGPVISLTLEIGRLQDGGFVPVDDQQPHNPQFYTIKGNKAQYYTQGQYKKVERETFAAIHKFLLTSITCAADFIAKP